MSTSKVKMMAESAIMLTLSVILSILKLADLPAGGSITVASLLPLVIIAYRYGTRWGVCIGLIYGIIQQLLGLNTLSYVTTWQSVLAVILLDYVIAFAFAGLAGAFRKIIKNQAAAMCSGAVLVCLLRYACHVISGATVWAGLSIPTEAATVYSLIYNATYMIPETIVLVIAVYYVGSMLDFGSQTPVRISQKNTQSGLLWYDAAAGLAISAAAIFDTVEIFKRLQNADSGEFDVTQISSVNWSAIICVSAAAITIAAVLFVVKKLKSKKTN